MNAFCCYRTIEELLKKTIANWQLEKGYESKGTEKKQLFFWTKFNIKFKKKHIYRKSEHKNPTSKIGIDLIFCDF